MSFYTKAYEPLMKKEFLQFAYVGGGEGDFNIDFKKSSQS